MQTVKKYKSGHSIRAALGENELHVNFEIAGDDGEMEIRGSVKYDGCMTWETNNACMFHFCSPTDAERLASMLVDVWAEGKKLMPKTDEGYGIHEAIKNRWDSATGINNQEATPRPWPEPKYGNDEGAGGETFWQWWDIEGVAEFENEGNAYLAHRAVNAHDALVTAAEKALYEMCHTVAARNSFTDAVDSLDAALALARGGK